MFTFYDPWTSLDPANITETLKEYYANIAEGGTLGRKGELRKKRKKVLDMGNFSCFGSYSHNCRDNGQIFLLREERTRSNIGIY